MGLEYNCCQFQLRLVCQSQDVLGYAGLLNGLFGNVDVGLVGFLFDSLCLFLLFVLYFLFTVWAVGG